MHGGRCSYIDDYRGVVCVQDVQRMAAREMRLRIEDEAGVEPVAGSYGVWKLGFFFQAEDGIRDLTVTGVQTWALPMFAPPPAQCPTGKWTGGGRIDPTGTRTAANCDNVDEPSPTGDPPPAPEPAPYFTGKFTFGFNVFLATNAANRCFVQKGEIEVNGHPFKVAWHVSIHDGVDTFSGDSVFANVFAD